MEKRIGWLGSSSSQEQKIDETLIMADTYSGEEIRLTPEQLSIVQVCQRAKDESLADLIKWGGFNTTEEAEAFLTDETEAHSQ